MKKIISRWTFQKFIFPFFWFTTRIFIVKIIIYLNNILNCMIFKLIFVEKFIQRCFQEMKTFLLNVSISNNIFLQGYSLLKLKLKLFSKIWQKHLIHDNCNCSIWNIHIFINICREMSWSKIDTSMKFTSSQKSKKNCKFHALCVNNDTFLTMGTFFYPHFYLYVFT